MQISIYIAPQCAHNDTTERKNFNHMLPVDVFWKSGSDLVYALSLTLFELEPHSKGLEISVTLGRSRSAIKGNILHFGEYVSVNTQIIACLVFAKD